MLVVGAAEAVVGVPVNVRRSKEAKGSAKGGREALVTLWEGAFGRDSATEGVGRPWRFWWRWEVETMPHCAIEEESMGKVAKVSKVVDGKRYKCEFVTIDGGATNLRDGEFALGCNMVNGMSQKYGVVLIVQFSRIGRGARHTAVRG